MFKSLKFLFVLISSVYCNVYLHSPRGSNNRGAEDAGQQTANNNRLFNSRNDNAGGYNYGPKMYFYEESLLHVEWTATHGCGKDSEVNCQFILQYMCDEMLRDGTTNGDLPLNEADSMKKEFGYHESYKYYMECRQRPRNSGLFVADVFDYEDQQQNNVPVRDKAIHTRQTCRRGNNFQCLGKYGYECPEERDYYPYWHPTPWRDIAVLTNDVSMCDYYKMNSQNTANKGWCTEMGHNNQKSCEGAGARWDLTGGWGIESPDCRETEPLRANHLGNTPSGWAMSYTWSVPKIGSLPMERKFGVPLKGIKDKYMNCALRIRYNISSSDYDWDTDSTQNTRFKSPIENRPNIAIPAPDAPMAKHNLSIATYSHENGKTYQDRSYAFEIRPRPDTVLNKIYNLNVIGRRGNIVQTFPAVEYDFRPNVLTMKKGEWLHPQWTGSDNNAANQAGEGKDETDRSNIVQIEDLRDSHPLPFYQQNLFESKQAIRMAFVDQDPTKCDSRTELEVANPNDDEDEDDRNCAKLNTGTPYFDGNLQKMNNIGTFYYMSTRNNNFSNRGQKGTIVVEDCRPNCVFDSILFTPGAMMEENMDMNSNAVSYIPMFALITILVLFFAF